MMARAWPLLALALAGCGGEGSDRADVAPQASRGELHAWSVLPPVAGRHGAVRRAVVRGGASSWLMVFIDEHGSLHGSTFATACSDERRARVSPAADAGWSGPDLVASDRGGIVAPDSSLTLGIAVSVACAGHGVAEVKAVDADMPGVLRSRSRRTPTI